MTKKNTKEKLHPMENARRLAAKLAKAMDGYSQESGGEWVAHVWPGSKYERPVMFENVSLSRRFQKAAPHPEDLLNDALSAFNGVRDLIVNGLTPGRNDMHLVNPENLVGILDLIAERMHAAAGALDAVGAAQRGGRRDA